MIALDSTNAFARMDRLEIDAADLNGPMGDALLDAGNVYLEAMAMRFASAARGDGTWAPLAESTLKRKRQNSDLILILGGDLYTSLLPGDPNNVLRLYSAGGMLGIAAGTAHPLAVFHHFGTGRLPRRTILIDPDPLARTHMDAAVSAGPRNLIAALRGGA